MMKQAVLDKTIQIPESDYLHLIKPDCQWCGKLIGNKKYRTAKSRFWNLGNCCLPCNERISREYKKRISTEAEMNRQFRGMLDPAFLKEQSHYKKVKNANTL